MVFIPLALQEIVWVTLLFPLPPSEGEGEGEGGTEKAAAVSKIRTPGHSSGFDLGRLRPLTPTLSPETGEREDRWSMHPHKNR